MDYVMNDGTQYGLDAKTRIEETPSLRPYMEWIAFTCGCSMDELGILEVVNPKEEDEENYADDEGWELESFFGDYDAMDSIALDRDVATEDFSIGFVAILKYKGQVFVAEQNASPFIIYGRMK